MKSSAKDSLSMNEYEVEYREESAGESVDTFPVEQTAKAWVGVCFALFLSAIGVTVAVQSWRYGLGTDENIIGPGTTPVVLGALLVIGGPIIAIKDLRTLTALRAKQNDNAEPGFQSRSRSRFVINSLLMPAGIVLIYLVGIYLSQFTGVLLTLSAVVFICGLFVEKMPVWKSLIMALAMMLLGYLIFDLMLAARFPESLVGF